MTNDMLPSTQGNKFKFDLSANHKALIDQLMNGCPYMGRGFQKYKWWDLMLHLELILYFWSMLFIDDVDWAVMKKQLKLRNKY